jgi:predicted small lipoprotein YifL
MIRNLILVAALGATLAACGSKGNNGDQPPPVVVTPRQEDQFGANFGTAFRRDPNTDPVNVADGDVVPLSLTNEAVAIN